MKKLETEMEKLTEINYKNTMPFPFTSLFIPKKQVYSNTFANILKRDYKKFLFVQYTNFNGQFTKKYSCVNLLRYRIIKKFHIV